MDKIDWNAADTIAPSEIPAGIATYLEVHEARDVDRAIAMYAPDAVVTDEDHDYHGVDQIRAWMTSAGSQYTYTTTLTGASRLDADHVDVLQRLEGDFPGGVADLHFRFTLDGDRIVRLVIEP
jgi:ketosteroid isomerase-like protein